jgi:hypothetical protein
MNGEMNDSNVRLRKGVEDKDKNIKAMTRELLTFVHCHHYGPPQQVHMQVQLCSH